MTQPEFLPLLNSLVAILLAGNIFFLKKLVDRIEKAMDELSDLKVKVAVLEVNPCNERKEI